MNAYYRALAQVANAIVALWRWVTSVVEGPGYTPRPVGDHVVSVEAQAAAWAFPTPKLPLSECSDTVPQPNLVRPFVGALNGHPPVSLAKRFEAVGRAAVVRLDALGLPLAPMAGKDSPTVGIFDQAMEAWRTRTGNINAFAAPA